MGSLLQVDTMVSERSPTSMRHTAVFQAQPLSCSSCDCSFDERGDVDRTSDYGKPMTVGIVFASSQASKGERGQGADETRQQDIGPRQVPGYHPVIAGLFDYLP